MKHKAFTLVEALVVIAILGVLAAILWPVFQRPRCHGSRRPGCASNLKQIGLALAQYAQDYDETLPPVAVARAGYWAGSLQPYIKCWQIFQCPSDAGSKPKTTDYFYNSRLAATEQKQVTWPQSTIALGEGTGDQLPLYHLSQLPPQWVDDADSPANRHCEGANYGFADGHVKWLAPAKITLDKPAAGAPTFLVCEGEN